MRNDIQVHSSHSSLPASPFTETACIIRCRIASLSSMSGTERLQALQSTSKWRHPLSFVGIFGGMNHHQKLSISHSRPSEWCSNGKKKTSNPNQGHLFKIQSPCWQFHMLFQGQTWSCAPGLLPFLKSPWFLGKILDYPVLTPGKLTTICWTHNNKQQSMFNNASPIPELWVGSPLVRL